MKQIDKKELSNTPTFTKEIYNRLPKLLSECVSHFNNEREKDVVLLSAIGVLSGCFPSVEGKYANDMVAPNLFTFILAPAASGKGVMKYSKYLGEGIQDTFLQKKSIADSTYKEQLKNWTKSKKEVQELEPKPTKPKSPVLYFPGNTSSASLYNLLEESGGTGIMMETEADTLANALKQDWGNFSDLFRKAFHHETVSLSRKADFEYVEIKKPKLSLVLSGTLSQVSNLIASAEDGLFSRFCYYLYSREANWIDPTPCLNCPDISAEFNKYGVEVMEIKNQLDILTLKFILSAEQFKKLSNNFEDKLNQIVLFEGSEASSSVFRLGLICFRIAMILTILRNSEKLKELNQLQCDDIDLDNALLICNALFEHTSIMYSLLPKQESSNLSPKLRQFYSKLPESFQRKEADSVGKTLTVCDRTVHNYLTTLVNEKFVERDEKFGNYKKIVKAA